MTLAGGKRTSGLLGHVPLWVWRVIFVVTCFCAPAAVMTIHDRPIRARVASAPALWKPRLQGLIGKRRSVVIGVLNSRYHVGYSLGDTSRELYPGPKRLTKSDFITGIPLGETYSPPFTWRFAIGLTYDRQGRLVAYNDGADCAM